MDRRSGCLYALIRVLLVPGALGLALGYAFVAAFLWLERPTEATPAVTTAVTPSAGPARATILLLDSTERQVAGVWQWWAEPEPLACIVSLDSLVEPHGQTVEALFQLALAAGGDAWVAHHVKHLAAGCRPDLPGADEAVLFVPQEAFVEWVGAMGGAQLAGQRLDGLEAWLALSSQPDHPATCQVQQREIWLALAGQVQQATPSFCTKAGRAAEAMRVVGLSQDACRLFELVLRKTPPDILTPGPGCPKSPAQATAGLR